MRATARSGPGGERSTAATGNVRRPVVRGDAWQLPRVATPALQLEAVPVGEWSARIETLRRRDGATFADLFAGPPTADGRVSLTVLLARPDQKDWVALRDVLQPGSGYPSLREVAPAADWYEREVFERFGLAALGGAALLPLGHTVAGHADLVLADERLGAPGAGVVDYPLGPVRSGIVESGHYTIRTVGEEIVDLRLQLAWKHRGIEELATGLDWLLVPLLVERISGTDAVAHGLAAATALEALAGWSVTPRAQALRVLAAELERLHDHAGFQAELCQATGLAVGQAQFEIVRERLLRLAAALSGHRYLFGFVSPGGMQRDPGEAALEEARTTIARARGDLEELGRLAAASGSHMDRLIGTGIVNTEQAESLALVGPVARSAGVDGDARRDHPYAAYADLNVPIALRRSGDAAARAAVRLEEAITAADLALRVLAQLPDGPMREAPRQGSLPGEAVALGWAEGSRGAELHWVETDPAGRIARYRVRSASFACWQGFARCIPGGNILTDFPIIEQSFGLSYAGSDR